MTGAQKEVPAQPGVLVELGVVEQRHRPCSTDEMAAQPVLPSGRYQV